MGTTKVIKSDCILCINSCGINAYVEDGRLVKVEGMKEHPISEGALCPRGYALPEWVYSKNRLQYPMKKANGQWERISWDEAYDAVVENVEKIKEQYGAEAISTWHGTGRNVWHLGAKITYSGFGSPNLTSLLSGMAVSEE